MEFIQASLLGIVQGLSEFFPISSSGHLIIIPQIFNWQGTLDTLSFDVSLHLGTAAALVIYFWKDWIKLIGKFLRKIFFDRKKLLKDQDSRLFLLLVIGSVPAGIAGILFKDLIESNTRSVLLIGITLILFGILLWYFDRKGKNKKELIDISFKDATLIGVTQAISLVPGVSRSGITITAARFLNIDRESSVHFSFLLSTPAILGAGLIMSKDILETGFKNPQIFVIGFLFSAISGIFAIKFLIYLSKSKGFIWFVIYRFILGLFLVLF